jgi:hypothetical protein
MVLNFIAFKGGVLIVGAIAAFVSAMAAVKIVSAMNAEVRANPCPQCGQPLGDKKPGARTHEQVMWGGWTCPDCGCDVDRHGKVRAS